MDHSYYESQASTDEALVLLIQQGDEHAFTSFFKRHHSAMYLAAYHLLRDEDDAHDAVQDLFSDVWQRSYRIDTTRNIKGYLYTVLRNRILSAMSRSKYVDEYINSFMAFERQSVCTTEETVLMNELEKILEEKINQLPPKMREVYELSWREQLNNKEIAHRMAISEGTVKQHKYQAVRILRGKLQRLVSLFLFF